MNVPMVMTKHQQQTVALILTLIIFVGVLVFAYWAKIMPVPVGGGEFSPPTAAIQLPPFDDGLLKRNDFRSLKSFAEIGAMPVVQSGADPFRPASGQ